MDSLSLAPEAPEKAWQPRTNREGGIVPGRPDSEDPVEKASFILPENPQAASLLSKPDLDKAHVYTLADLIDIAASNNPLTRMAWNAAREVALAAGITRSLYLPRLTAVAVGGHQTFQIKGSEPIKGQLGTGGEGAVTALSLNWLLFDFGQRDALVEAAEEASVISNIGFTEAHQKLIHEVSLAFYAHAAARSRVKLAEESLQKTQAVELAAKERLEAGVGTVMDYTKAQQGTAHARLGVIQASGSAENTYLALLTSTGLSPFTKIQIEDISDRKLQLKMVDEVEAIVTDALSRRPDILAAYSRQKEAAATVKAAEAEFLPKLFLSGTGSYTYGDLYLTQIPSIANQSTIGNFAASGMGATVFGGLTLPIYDGGTRDALLHQARTKAENAALALEHAQKEAVREIVQATNTLRAGISTYEAAGAVVKASETSFEASLAAYRNGVSSITEVTMAETLLLQSLVAVTEARSASLSAAATLALATGSLGSSLD